MLVLTRIVAITMSALVVSGCASGRDVLAIDMASSVAAVSEDISSSVTEQTGLSPQITQEGTATLVQHIREGKNTDILLSADVTSLAHLVENKLIWGEPVSLAQNSLVLAVAADNAQSIRSLEDLENPSVKVVQCAPQVPCGKLTENVITAFDLDYTPLTQTQNVSGALRLLLSGDADAAFVYASDVHTSNGKLVVVQDERMSGFDTTVTGVVIASSQYPEQSQQLLKYWASPDFATVWADAGFIPLGAR